MDVVIAASKMAASLGIPFILDPAPAADLPDELLRNVSIIKPNEIEAAMITGIEVTDQDSAAQATKALRAKGIDIAIVTLGKAGVVINDRGQISHCPACKVGAVDTTAAGDAFTGGLVHMLAQGHSLDQACRFASKVSALSVTKYGAQASMPSLQEVNDFAAFKQ